MYVEMVINGVIKASWYYDHSQLEEPYCEVGIDEKELAWKKIIVECKEKAGSMIYESGNYEFYFTVPASVQPKHIPDDEYWRFVNELEKIKANPITKIKKRFT